MQSAAPGTKLSSSGSPGTQTVAGTDNPSGRKSPRPPVNSSTEVNPFNNAFYSPLTSSTSVKPSLTAS